MRRALGEFEITILLALIRTGRETSSVALRREIEARTGRVVAPGALYTALDRLEQRGFVTSRLGDPTPERGGRRKRLYTMLPAGERMLSRMYESMQQMASGIAPRLRALKSKGNA